MENLTSTPLSIRDSGSAFMSQYDFSEESGAFSASGFETKLDCVASFPLVLVLVFAAVFVFVDS